MNPEIIRGFHASEFVPKEIHDQFGTDKSWWFIRPEIVLLCEFMRMRFQKPLTCNNWKAGGKLSYRGYRPRTYNTGGENSQHRFGCAADINIEGVPPDEIREDILQYKDMYMDKGLTTIEHKDFAPTWVHFDIRCTGMNEILIVKPL